MFRGRLPVAIAAIFAILAGLVAFWAVNRQRAEIASGWEPVPVMVATSNMRAGEKLERSSFDVGEIPKALVTRSVITLQDYKRGTPLVGQKLAIDVHAGDPLLFQHVSSKTGMAHLAEAVQVSGRAVSIRVSAESAVHHWIEPSDRIDVIGIFRDPTSREMVAVTMLQNVIVLATGRIGGATNRQNLTEDEIAYNTITVHVLPEAVEMLVLAQELGSLYLSLRNPEDNEIQDLGESKTTMTTLLTGERSKRISTRQNKIFKVEVIRGGSRETQVVP